MDKGPLPATADALGRLRHQFERTCFFCGQTAMYDDSFVLNVAEPLHMLRLHRRCALRLTVDVLEMIGRVDVPSVPQPPHEAPVELSPREIDVLEGMARGEKDREIAHRLGIAEHTVKNHAYDVRRKIGARSRTDAAIRALRYGLIEDQPIVTDEAG